MRSKGSISVIVFSPVNSPSLERNERVTEMQLPTV
jgi:hypothetical protein